MKSQLSLVSVSILAVFLLAQPAPAQIPCARLIHLRQTVSIPSCTHAQSRTCPLGDVL